MVQGLSVGWGFTGFCAILCRDSTFESSCPLITYFGSGRALHSDDLALWLAGFKYLSTVDDIDPALPEGP